MISNKRGSTNTVLTNNKHIFVKGVLIMRKSAYFSKRRISHLRYSLYRIDFSFKIGLFVFNFRKFFSGINMAGQKGCAFHGKSAYYEVAYYD